MSIILVIEDDVQSYRLMAAILLRQGHTVLHAQTGTDGIDLALERQPGLILLDIMLPGMSGYEVARRIKNHPELHHIPILAVSVLASQGAVREAIAAGCNEFIHKPFAVGELQKHIQRYTMN